MKRNLPITALLLAGALAGRAQQKDTLAILRMFMKVSNEYKVLPVEGEIDIHNSANMVLSAADTSHMRARFVLRSEGTYIDMGEMEQIVNDSVLLLVSRPLKRMLLYANNRSVSEQLRLSTGLQVQDSSLRKLAGKYEANYILVAKDTGEIVVTSRSTVQLTALPTGIIKARFNPVSLQPYSIVQVTRKLRRVEELDFELLTKQLGEGMTIHRDSGYYVIHERVSEYRYRCITHAQGGRLPVTLADRIDRDAEGKYKPIGLFADYSISKEF